MKKFPLILTLVVTIMSCCLQVSTTYAQAQENYILRFKDIAMQEMQKHGIPASITLAQGILESGNGQSRLATKGNNHFGIKCHDWTGETIYEDDDAPQECFRKYKNASESYHDHSLFLTGRSRYAFLFDLNPLDYKGWAKGLKKAGYATNPEYANILIRLIERHELFKYDQNVDVIADVPAPVPTTPPVVSVPSRPSGVPSGTGTRPSKPTPSKGSTTTPAPSPTKPPSSGACSVVNEGTLSADQIPQIFLVNRSKTVRFNCEVSILQVAEAYNIPAKRLVKYNDLNKRIVPAKTNIFLQPKKGKTVANQRSHKVAVGETMLEISQLYGIKLKKLYKRNGVPIGMQPADGEVLVLNQKRKTPAKYVKSKRGKSTGGQTTKPAPNQPQKPRAGSSTRPSGTPSSTRPAPTPPRQPDIRPAPTNPQPPATPQYMSYTVKQGDTLYSIARAYNTTVEAIKQANNLASNDLSIGQVLRIVR